MLPALRIFMDFMAVAPWLLVVVSSSSVAARSTAPKEGDLPSRGAANPPRARRVRGRSDRPGAGGYRPAARKLGALRTAESGETKAPLRSPNVRAGARSGRASAVPKLQS